MGVHQKTTQSNQPGLPSFLITEYNNIAQAHFKTSETITTFFRYYLIIVALPVPICGILFRMEPASFSSLDQIPTFGLLLASTICLAISVCGMCVAWYVTELRGDAILYARTVNGIRKHFYDLSGLKPKEEMSMRVLPRSIAVPRHRDWFFFGGVLVSFIVIDTIYFALGYVVYLATVSPPSESTGMINTVLCTMTVFSYLVLHVIGYIMLTDKREKQNLKCRSVGVDIDGVLNLHREHFCHILKRHTGKQISPDTITKIPVHECKELGITPEEEQSVFEDIDYWTQMPACLDAVHYIRKLRRDFGYKIYIVSHRPWPRQKLIGKDWWRWYVQRIWPYPSLRIWPLPVLRPAMWRITRSWLRKCRIEYDKLLIEEGHIYSARGEIAARNRYVLAAKKMIPLFVEDVKANACKLADTCEIVFLLKHPYNKDSQADLPKNVIPVNSWKEIYHFVRDNY